ncbi:hypothetical protein AB0M46_07385 [Dactylosporangium sp. NPDC051485]|uniref:hypothetical protein n=1 Tax=Dactylosporangium sp. NPDC051485 TaxID=3154846 RepID=UPI00343CCB24
MKSLRDRYVRLLRWYPPAYRAERGDELVDMYLDLARPGQRRPRPSDVLDLVRSGLRQCLREHRASGLADALPFAAGLAIMGAAIMAGAFLRIEDARLDPYLPFAHPGPFVTLGGFVWLAWLLPPIGLLFGLARPAVWLALAVTVGVVVATPLTPYVRPPLFVLVPQAALGIVALGIPARRRLVTAAGALAGAGLAVLVARMPYYYSARPALEYTATLIALVGAGAGVVFLARRDRRAFWPLLILLTPMLLLAQAAWMSWPEPAGMVTAAVRTVLDVAAGLAAIPITVWLRGRLPVEGRSS